MPKFGLEFVPMDAYWKTIYYAILAEKKGFDYVWITDHYNNRNVFVLLTTIALQTSRIKFGPGVTNPYLMHPVMTAQSLISINELAPGRVVCGFGPGDLTTLDMILPERPKPLMTVREAVEVMRGIFEKGKVKFEGSVYKVPNARLNFKPQGVVPIFIGAQGPRMLSLAGEVGDGVMINASHPQDFERALGYVRKGASKAGKRFEDLEIIAATSVSVAKDEKKAVKAALPVVAFIVAGCPPSVLEGHGIDVEAGQRIKEAIMKGAWKEAFSAVTPEMLEAFSIVGTPAAVVEKVDRLLKLGITLLVAGSPIGSNVRKAIGLLSEEVLARLK